MSVVPNFVEIIRGPMRWQLDRFGTDADYTLHDGSTAVLRVYVRRVRAEDLFAGAMQQDIAAIVAADQFRAAFPSRFTPARLDRIRTPEGRSYVVEEHGGSPQINPVFFKMLVRGGQQ